MVRLESSAQRKYLKLSFSFTFQYGQIRKRCQQPYICQVIYIYIPVWLDQKASFREAFSENKQHLHSSMVRLERRKIITNMLRSNLIYIPVWLDQKVFDFIRIEVEENIFTFQYGQIRKNYIRLYLQIILRFTFQYGQIRKKMIRCFMIKEICIYIPVWLDQKENIPPSAVIKIINLHSSMVRLESLF